jgi:hypothetical protein
MAGRVVTVVDEDTVREMPAEMDGEDLWADARASGWEIGPAGLCRGALCVPLPGADATVLGGGDRINLGALARLRAQAVAHDEDGTTWVFGTPGAARDARTSVDAPEFELPDLEGRRHALSAERGRKVLLASWASW